MTDLAIIVNNQAKNALQAKSYVDYFKEQGIVFSLFQVNSKILNETLEKCCQRYNVVLIGGGDGSIRSAAQHCVNKAITLGILPLGTMNHFAKELGLPLTKEELVNALKENKSIKIDLAEVNGHIFVNNSSIGFYPKFAQHRDRYTKAYNKWLSYFPSLMQTLKKHETYSIHISNDYYHRDINTSFMMMSNNLYSYEFPISIKRESFTQNRLGIYYFRYGRLRFFKMLRLLLNRKSNFAVIDTDKPVTVVIDNKQKVMISLDGDTLEVDLPLVYRIIPHSLQILTDAS